MTPSRPYLLRALHEWIVDNGMTPYILVDAEQDQVEVPAQYVENGKIVFNVGPTAVRNLDLGNERVMLDARFSGNPFHVDVPINAVIAIYARENGKGMVFTDEEEGEEPPTPPTGGDGDDKSKRPTLRVVK